MILLVESAIKVALIVLVALAFMPLLRKQTAALRHWILGAALVCAAAAPIGGAVMPSWHLPIVAMPTAGEFPSARPVASVSAPGAPAVDPPEPLKEAPISLGASLRAIWIAGAFGSGLVLFVGLMRLVRLASTARRISEGVWIDCALQICHEYGLRRQVTLLQSHHPSLLVTWGILRPKVLLPAGAQRWDVDRVRVVLSHELAHVRRGDWPFQIAAELLRCIYWFNPLVWLACRRLRQESEQACDDAVMNRGVDGAEYGTHLVEIARELQHRRTWVPAPSIARSSTLERRVKAMLDTQVNRRPLSRLAGATALLGLLAVAIPGTGVAVAQVFGTVGGSIVDPMNGAVPGVTLVLTNTQTQAKYEVRSDRAGRYEFVGLTAGDYLLEAKLPGFAVLRGKLTVGGQNVQQDLKLEVGSLSETITVRAHASRPDRYVPAGPDMQSIERSRRQREVQCTIASRRDAATVGGNIHPPRKLHDVRPLYPAAALNAGIEGTVVLRGRISTDGTIDAVEIVSTPHPDLAQAATDAVRQWQFDATLLNCVPIAVDIGMTVNFQLER